MKTTVVLSLNTNSSVVFLLTLSMYGCVLLAVGWVVLPAEVVSFPSPKHDCPPSGKERKAAGEYAGTSKAAEGLPATRSLFLTSLLDLGFPWHTRKGWRVTPPAWHEGF